MTTYVARRLLAAIPLLLIVSALVFALSYLIPGDPAVELAGGTHATREQVIKVRHQLHFDEPLVKQYARWLTHALRGDLGQSLIRNRSVSSEIRSRFPVTFSLALERAECELLCGDFEKAERLIAFLNSDSAAAGPGASVTGPSPSARARASPSPTSGSRWCSWWCSP